jgi:hypothetical protein
MGPYTKPDEVPSPSRFVGTDGNGIQEAGLALCEFVDPRGTLIYNKGPRRPLVIFSFDESHVLTETPRGGIWTLFSELRRTLGRLVKLPLFSLFLSTAGHFRQFSPETKSDPSSRITNKDLHALDPITEISFDCLLPPVMEDSVTLNQVVQMEWMSHLGRPLYVSVLRIGKATDME